MDLSDLLYQKYRLSWRSGQTQMHPVAVTQSFKLYAQMDLIAALVWAENWRLSRVESPWDGMIINTPSISLHVSRVKREKDGVGRELES